MTIEDELYKAGGEGPDLDEVKPLFVPLFKRHFLMIKNGQQGCEIRPNGHRAWNCKNVYPGRTMLLSCGYGRQDRFVKEVRSTMITPDLRMEPIPEWHIRAVEAIYGKRDSWLIAYFSFGYDYVSDLPRNRTRKRTKRPGSSVY